MERRSAPHAGRRIGGRPRWAFQIGNKHEGACNMGTPLVFAVMLFRYVYAVVYSIRPRLSLGRFGLHEVDRLAGHDGRYRVLIYELRMAVAPQQHTKVVEPAYDPLELDAIDQKNRQRRLVLAHVVQERVLEVLDSICAHFCYPPVLGLLGCQVTSIGIAETAI